MGRYKCHNFFSIYYTFRTYSSSITSATPLHSLPPISSSPIYHSQECSVHFSHSLSLSLLPLVCSLFWLSLKSIYIDEGKIETARTWDCNLFIGSIASPHGEMHVVFQSFLLLLQYYQCSNITLIYLFSKIANKAKEEDGIVWQFEKITMKKKVYH